MSLISVILTSLVTLLMVMLHRVSPPLMTILGSPAHTELTRVSWMAQCLNCFSPISVVHTQRNQGRSV